MKTYREVRRTSCPSRSFDGLEVRRTVKGHLSLALAKNLRQRGGRSKQRQVNVGLDGTAAQSEPIERTEFAKATRVRECSTKAVCSQRRAREFVEAFRLAVRITKGVDCSAEFRDQPPLAFADFPVLLVRRLVREDWMRHRMTAERHAARLHLAEHVPSHPEVGRH